MIFGVNEVDGRGAVAVPGYTASRYELLVLLKHWATFRLDIRFDGFILDQRSSRDHYWYVFANNQITRIAEAFADEESLREAIEKVEEDYAKRNDGLAWKVFTKEASADEERKFRHEQDKLLSDGPSEEWFKTMCPFEPSNLPASE